MTYHVFFEDDDNIEITLSWMNYYRSSISRKNIKHCFEFTLLSEVSNKGAEIGFSSSINNRTFVAFYQHNNGILYMDNGEKYVKDCSIRQSIRETVQICYDSSSENLIIIKGDATCKETISLSNKQSWYAYLDHGETPSERVSLNMGSNKFINQIPEGFSPWFSDSNMNQITCIHQKYGHISILGLIPLLLHQ